MTGDHRRNMATVTACEYTERERAMMYAATRCLCCGVRLRYLHRKDARRNRGYCSLRCYYAKPPKMARIEREYEQPIETLLTEWLNRGLSQAEIARTLGICETTLYSWLDKLRVRQVTRWEVSR